MLKLYMRFIAKALFLSLLCHDSIAQVTVDISSNTGPIKYGGIGFLYGLGDDGVPTDNMIAALANPQIATQKAPNGLQHPNGDALKVSYQWKRNGGKEVHVNLQDYYKEWPYEKLGMADYKNKITTMMNLMKAHPNYKMMVCNPFNEPDWIWYGGNSQGMFQDFKTIYQHIKSIDPAMPVVGPSYSYYNANFYTDFFTFCKANNCVPDGTIWHELGDDVYTSWYTHYNHYRNLEKSLGISPRPITINEYGKSSGILGNPGQLIQLIARFENSKVNACLAYWTTAGCLNDLVTQNNKATGGWWLYKWYGELTGNTVSLTPPNSNAKGLQGIASLDASKKQTRVIFGGSAGNTNVIVKGFASQSYFGNTVHVTMWGADFTGTNPSNGPYLKMEGDYPVTNGQIDIPVNTMNANSVYQAIITPNTDRTQVNVANRLEAEYARLTGAVQLSAALNYTGTAYVNMNASTSKTQFVLTAASDGYYNLKLRYSTSQNNKLKLSINGLGVADVTTAATASNDTWADANIKAFLMAGINRVDFSLSGIGSINLDYLETGSTPGNSSPYEAESSLNTISGTATISNSATASGGKAIGYLGQGTGNSLQFNQVKADSAGIYRIVIRYVNGELGDGASNYNSNIVDRFALVQTNNGTAQTVFFRNTFGWTNYSTAVMDVELKKGMNTIKFYNASGFIADIDKIDVFGAVLSVPPVVSSLTDKEDFVEKDGILSYPNPFSDETNIYVNGRFNYSLYDLSGIEVAKGNAENFVRLGNDLVSGIYLVRLETSEGKKTIKLAKK
ncbi:MAG: T9SS type A sorting domain-containing protein [Opitutaceae bacterium]|nr:T9SS type A sorting domain-containing protein [Cytophagales bacterium]